MIVTTFLEILIPLCSKLLQDYVWYNTKWWLWSPISSNHPLSESRQLSIICLAAIIHYPQLTDISPDTTTDDAVTDSGWVAPRDKAFGESWFDWSLLVWLVVNFLWNFTLLSSTADSSRDEFQDSKDQSSLDLSRGGGRMETLWPIQYLALRLLCVKCCGGRVMTIQLMEASLAFICYCFVVCKLRWLWWGCLWGGHGEFWERVCWRRGGGRVLLGAGIILQIGLPATDHPITSLTSTATAFYCKAHSQSERDICEKILYMPV